MKRENTFSYTLTLACLLITAITWSLKGHSETLPAPIHMISDAWQIEDSDLWLIKGVIDLADPCIESMESSITRIESKPAQILLKQSARYSNRPCIQMVQPATVMFVISSPLAFESLTLIDATTGKVIPVNPEIKEEDHVYKGKVSEVH